MNLQQLRYVVEVVRRGLKVSDAALALFTSQPGVSKQIRLLEEELGIDIFVRHGKRFTGITPPGQEVVAIAQRVLQEIQNLEAVAHEFGNESKGVLTLATTHTQARYALPPVIRHFIQRYPDVRLSLRQGNPAQVCAMVLAGEADLAIATEGMHDSDGLLVLPCHQWNRCVIAPRDHPILRSAPLTLEEMARWPLITYDDTFTGGSQVNKAFLGRGLHPNVVLTALDSDVIKTYVGMGMGIGLMARMAFDPLSDRGLGMVDASHLFEAATTRIGIRKNTWLRAYVYAFIEAFAPHLTRKVLEKGLQQGGGKEGETICGISP
jgi:LysR family transcriptional regulator, cys regulon transcriptional activator